MAILPGQRTLVSSVSGRTCRQGHSQEDIDIAYQYEAQQYRHALSALIDKIRCSDETELQELLEAIRKPDTLTEAVQETLRRKYC
ncbi:uncharacterized protein N7511_004331 [Penicillium nucicola]|uniref:uncharacterized protein n=1 Tax=Penicillium nucicola TaxID=1850975 RepID=UPI002545828C|nr:uncharacterized protein N7511_004285 [Penicillium nucicola]XP_056985646.1 uncharacterized protein N7511_004331 [Penicillium nucicola]KAJ5766669.1 hypothetical protein N7511_004285 [Penicillium nucicola]KAJ5766715.1 hypothetical protein N7511_004331 [Penicillium nucicola]